MAEARAAVRFQPKAKSGRLAKGFAGGDPNFHKVPERWRRINGVPLTEGNEEREVSLVPFVSFCETNTDLVLRSLCELR